MTENLDSNNPTTPQSGTPAPAPESVVVPPKAPQTKKETIRISLPPKPAAPGRPSAPVSAPAAAPAAAKSAAPAAPAVPAGTALKMSGTPGPQNPTAAPKQRAAASSKAAGGAAGGKVQMIDQVLAILVAVAAIACVVTSFMLNNLGNTSGY